MHQLCFVSSAMDAGQHFGRREEQHCDFDWEYSDETEAHGRKEVFRYVSINRSQQVSCPARLSLSSVLAIEVI